MKYVIKKGLVWEEINDELVVLDPIQGKYFNLNKTAAFVWGNIIKPKSEQELIKLSLKSYKENKYTNMKKDLRNCLDNLVKLNIVECV